MNDEHESFAENFTRSLLSQIENISRSNEGYDIADKYDYALTDNVLVSRIVAIFKRLKADLICAGSALWRNRNAT
ncbi:MAG TPA: hypothetical protein VL625_12195 [Patescibacteria group bacterium]|jgi:hypothetical protein|nr:hypothetical protein [Patescibacteria group bacterium]